MTPAARVRITSKTLAIIPWAVMTGAAERISRRPRAELAAGPITIETASMRLRIGASAALAIDRFLSIGVAEKIDETRHAAPRPGYRGTSWRSCHACRCRWRCASRIRLRIASATHTAPTIRPIE